MIAALGGLIYLVFPGLESPPLFHSVLMAFAGIAWGFYTLRGKRQNPLADTTENFVRAVPIIIIEYFRLFIWMKLSWSGVLFAVLSGAIASGIGYAVWYAALKYHTATTRRDSATFSSRIGGNRRRYFFVGNNFS